MHGETLNQLSLTRAALSPGGHPKNKLPSARLARRTRAATRILLCFLVCVCGPAKAFNAWEHETLSQLSLLVASNHVSVTFSGPTNALDRLSDLRDIVTSYYAGLPETAEWRKPGSVAITYGEIALLADYMKDTYDMLHLPQSRVNLPVDAKTINLPYLRSLVEHGDRIISLASASHEAYSHFQGRALDAFCSHHKLAVAAASETNLWGALLLSAYANHFLQDVFAPGHLLTPRDANAHDLDVAMLHDDFNNQGLMYVIEAPQQLMNLADTARAYVRNSAKQWRSQDGKPKHTLSLTNSAFDIFCDRLATQARVDVLCLGDDRMPESSLQPILMLAYCARAVTDVLESYLRGSPTNSYSDYVWDRRTLGDLNGVQLIDLRLPYGGLTCRHRVPTKKIIRETERLAAYDDSITNYNVTTSLTRPIYRNPGFALSLGFESVSDFGGSRVRGLLDAEALLTGGRRDISSSTEQFKERSFPRNLWPRNWGLTLGYSGVFGSDDHGQGAFARAIWPIASLNVQISLQVGGRYYWGEGVEGFRDFEMLRADWGLHVLSLYVAVGHDYYTYANQGFHSGLAFEAGISIALPYSKFKNLRGMID